MKVTLSRSALDSDMINLYSHVPRFGCAEAEGKTRPMFWSVFHIDCISDEKILTRLKAGDEVVCNLTEAESEAEE